jgi:hypothetical protein
MTPCQAMHLHVGTRSISNGEPLHLKIFSSGFLFNVLQFNSKIFYCMIIVIQVIIDILFHNRYSQQYSTVYMWNIKIFQTHTDASLIYASNSQPSHRNDDAH